MSKINNGRRAKNQPISLFPEHNATARQRAAAAGLTLSRYIQTLIGYDKRHNIIAQAMEDTAMALREKSK